MIFRLSLLLCLFCFQLKSQFFALRTASLTNSSYETVYSNLWKLSTDRYAVNIHSYNPSGEFVSTQAYIYNANKQLVDSVFFPKYFFPCDTRPSLANHKLFFSGYLKDTSVVPAKFYFSIYCLDTLGNFVQLKRIRYINNFPAYTAFDRIMSNVAATRFSLFSAVKDSTGGQSKLVIYRLNLALQKSDSISINTNGPKGPVRLLALNDKILVTNFGYSICPQAPAAGLQTILLDTNFQYVGCKNYGSLPMVFVNGQNQYVPLHPLGFNLVKISETKFSLNCMTAFDYAYPPQTLPPRILFNAINVLSQGDLSVNDRVIYFDSLYGSGYYPNTEFSDYYKAKDEMLTIGRINWNYSATIAGQNSSTKMLITKTDSIGNIKWVRKYWDGFLYAPSSIIFTEDGGCIISGLRSDTSTGIRSYESFLYRLDENGTVNPTSLIENSSKKRIINCIPNPVYENQIKIEISSPNSCEVVITDVLGRQIKLVSNYSNLQTIDVNSLPNGLYYFRVASGAVVENGSFVIAK